MARWKDKPKEERMLNSQNGRCEPIDSLSYLKWCENCGEEYETVNKYRKICDRCHDLKCSGGGYRKMFISPDNVITKLSMGRR